MPNVTHFEDHIEVLSSLIEWHMIHHIAQGAVQTQNAKGRHEFKELYKIWDFKAILPEIATDF